MNDSGKRLAVAYCRVSTDHEEQKKSIVEQQKQWLELFSKTGSQSANVGLICHRAMPKTTKAGKEIKGSLVTEPRTDGLYIDEGISGKSLHNRKAFIQMLEDAKLRKFDMIYVEDVSRYSRSIEDGYTTIKDLRELGVGVYFRKEGWNSLDLSKDFELQLRLSIAQEENRSKSDRIKWAMDRLRKKGGWNSTPPYGYDKKDGFLIINPVEAEYVKKVFYWFTHEMWGLGKIVGELNRIEAPTKRGGLWRVGHISDMLRNPIYDGRQITHRVESYDITRNSRKQIDPDEWCEFPKEELRIIDKDMFALAQIEYSRRTEKYTKGNRQRTHLNDNNEETYHVLSSLLFCSKCGASYRRKKRYGYKRKDGTANDLGYEWVCRVQDAYGNDTTKMGTCPGERLALAENDVIEAIKYEIQSLKRNSFDSTFKAYITEKYRGLSASKKKPLEEKVKNLNGEMRQLRQDKRDGLIDDDLYKEQMKELNKEISDCKTQISRIDRVQEERRHDIELFEAYKGAIDEIDINNLTNAVLKRVFHKIYVSYVKDSKGHKIPYVRYVYKFLDVSSDELMESQAHRDKYIKANMNVFKPLYLYKNEAEINEELVRNGLEPIDYNDSTEKKKTVQMPRKTKTKKLF